MNTILPIDVNEMVNNYKIDGGVILRLDDNRVLTGPVIVHKGQGIRRHRLIYVLENLIDPVGKIVVKNDSGRFISLEPNEKMIFNRRGSNHVTKVCKNVLTYRHKDVYLGRVLSLEGKRINKTFLTYEEAKEWSKQGMMKIWAEKFKKLDLMSVFD